VWSPAGAGGAVLLAICTTDGFIATNPDVVRRFLRATFKGWTCIVENPTAIGPLVVK
jgi:ABC-type nitrate/sulfonate/bicarbonate transport system substrate-binding protein